MGKITKRQLSEHIWLMDDEGASTGFVVVGKEKAMVIDTMNGSEDVKAIAESITGLPLILVNTHSHPDHIGGNHFFSEAYMHPLEMEYLDRFTKPENKEFAPVVYPVKEGDMFDLGGLHIEIYEIPGHTPGGICLLLVEDRVLFTGDSINHHLWAQLDQSRPITECLKSMERLDFLKERADYILHGHTRDFDPVSLMTDLEGGLRELATQEKCEVTEADADYHWFGGVDKQHSFDEFGSVICYRADNIR